MKLTMSQLPGETLNEQIARLQSMTAEQITEARNNDFDEREARGIITSRKFWQLHRRCPKCNSTHKTTTFAGFVEFPDKDFEDYNHVHCMSCGWKGTSMDLVP